PLPRPDAGGGEGATAGPAAGAHGDAAGPHPGVVRPHPARVLSRLRSRPCRRRARRVHWSRHIARPMERTAPMTSPHAIVAVRARQVYSGRGHPGIEATVRTANGAAGVAICTAGISVGQHEVAFVYDGGPKWR